MYFIFSKLLLFLISPFNWVLGILIIALIIKKRKTKTRLFISAGVIFLLFSIPLFLNQFANLWSYPSVKPEPKRTYSCVIVLGGFAGPGGPEYGHFNFSADRFRQGLKLKVSGRASHILITAGNPYLTKVDFNEAEWTHNQLKQFNIPDSTVLIENRSRNTIENAAFTKAILQNKHLAPPYLLVTSDFHMRRSMAIFTKAGLAVVPYPCNYFAGGKFSFSQLIPEAGIISNWDIYIKEMVGLIVFKLKR